ncbi:MAG: hypothetical protein JW904_03800 [Spirochaetales bacterium]|nr:hypothetical protein [Spirochaetales bacterium]
MNRIAFIIIFLVLSGVLFAEPGEITLSNSETSNFYYILDPQLGSSSPDGDTFTSLDMTKFTSISPGSSVRIMNLTIGTHHIIGFWGMPGTKEYSAWTLSFSIRDGEAKTFALRQKNLSGVKSANAIEYREIKIDNTYTEWEVYPLLAAFSKFYSPSRFKLQTKDSIREAPLSAAQYWGRGGTSIEKVKGFYGDTSFYLYFETSSRISSGLSIILYLFANRNPENKNYYTIEIVMDDTTGEGKILLWTRDIKEYMVVGKVRSSGFSAEAEVEIARLPEIVQKYLFDYYSFDLAINFFDERQGLHEEFFYTTLFFRDMVNLRDVGKEN